MGHFRPAQLNKSISPPYLEKPFTDGEGKRMIEGMLEYSRKNLTGSPADRRFDSATAKILIL